MTLYLLLFAFAILILWAGEIIVMDGTDGKPMIIQNGWLARTLRRAKELAVLESGTGLVITLLNLYRRNGSHDYCLKSMAWVYRLMIHDVLLRNEFLPDTVLDVELYGEVVKIPVSAVKSVTLERINEFLDEVEDPELVKTVQGMLAGGPELGEFQQELSAGIAGQVKG